MSKPALLIMVAAATVISDCQTAHAQFAPYPSRVQQQRGTITGGLAGAVIGAIVGDNNNEAGAGAAIGGAIGAVAGGVLGNASDKERAYVNNRRTAAAVAAPVATPVYAAPTYTPPVYTPPQTAVGVTDVINMSRSGLSENVMMNQIGSRGVTAQLSVPDIIELHRNGVTENVITAMQRAPVGGPATPAAVQSVNVARAPVVIREHVVVPHRVDVHHVHPPRRGYHYRRF